MRVEDVFVVEGEGEFFVYVFYKGCSGTAL